MQQYEDTSSTGGSSGTIEPINMIVPPVDMAKPLDISKISWSDITAIARAQAGPLWGTKSPDINWAAFYEMDASVNAQIYYSPAEAELAGKISQANATLVDYSKLGIPSSAVMINGDTLVFPGGTSLSGDKDQKHYLTLVQGPNGGVTQKVESRNHGWFSEHFDSIVQGVILAAGAVALGPAMLAAFGGDVAAVAAATAEAGGVAGGGIVGASIAPLTAEAVFAGGTGLASTAGMTAAEIAAAGVGVGETAALGTGLAAAAPVATTTAGATGAADAAIQTVNVVGSTAGAGAGTGLTLGQAAAGAAVAGGAATVAAGGGNVTDANQNQNETDKLNRQNTGTNNPIQAEPPLPSVDTKSWLESISGLTAEQVAKLTSLVKAGLPLIAATAVVKKATSSGGTMDNSAATALISKETGVGDTYAEALKKSTAQSDATLAASQATSAAAIAGSNNVSGNLGSQAATLQQQWLSYMYPQLQAQVAAGKVAADTVTSGLFGSAVKTGGMMDTLQGQMKDAAPVLASMNKEALDYNTAGNTERMAGLAVGDVRAQYSQQQAAEAQKLQSYGIDPTSGRYAGQLSASMGAEGAAAAAASSRARDAAVQLGWQRKIDAMSANGSNNAGYAAYANLGADQIQQYAGGQAAQNAQMGNLTAMQGASTNYNNSYTSISNAQQNAIASTAKIANDQVASDALASSTAASNAVKLASIYHGATGGATDLYKSDAVVKASDTAGYGSLAGSLLSNKTVTDGIGTGLSAIYNGIAAYA